jgi:MtrB/PioB family decaheme-associated outer membrane protein
MKKAALLLASFLSLLITSHVSAQDGTISGEISVLGRALNVDHRSAKFNEYDSIDGGILGSARGVYDTDTYRLIAEGSYIGKDDGYVTLQGRRWGAAKFTLFYNEFPHNYSFHDRSFYSGLGSDNLTFTSIPQNSAGWNDFKYEIKRKNFGGTLDVTMNSPFFVSFGMDRVEKEGAYPWGATSGVVSFGRMVEFPLPIDYTTTNMNLQAGYRSESYFLCLSGGLSSFDNGNEFVRLRDPFVQTSVVTATVSEPSDNASWNLKLNGTVKLPVNSTFGITAGYTRNTSETRLLNTIEDIGPKVTTLGINRSKFHGDVRYTDISAFLSSTPVKKLNTKIYYKYLHKDNRSDEVVYTDLTGATAPVANELFEYHKYTIGAEASYAFLRNLKATLGYDYTDLKRKRDDIPETWDNKMFAQVKYSPLDALGMRLKYQKLMRGAHYQREDVPATDDAYVDNFLRRYDGAQKDQDMVKASIDFTPLENLDATIEYAFKSDDYYKTVIGLTKSTRHEFVADASYRIKGVKLFGFFDLEHNVSKQTERQYQPGGTNADPSNPPTSSAFNWKAKLTYLDYTYGIGADIPIVKDKLSLTLQYDFEKNNGTADFTSQYLPASLSQNSIDIMPWDDYTKKCFSAKLKYDVREDLRLIFGYAYEQMRISDGSYNGYKYVVGTTATTYLTGAYRNGQQSYRANTYYLKTIYRF